VKWAALPAKESVPFDTAFPFVAKAPGIDPNPIFTRDVIILGNLPENDKAHETEPDKPKKQTEKTTTKKTARTAKTSKPDDSNIVSGMDIVIGIGVGSMGRHGHSGDHKSSGGGDMPMRVPKK
jgi:hypothetical protein